MIEFKEQLSLLRYLQIPSGNQASDRLLEFIQDHIHSPDDIILIHPFFDRLYDELCHKLLMKELALPKKLMRVIEALALPRQGNEHIGIYRYIQKVIEEMKKEKNKVKNSIK